MMATQHDKLLGFSIFVMFSLLSNAKNASVRVIGMMHCTDCIRHALSISPESSGVNVYITCKTKEKTIHGNGTVDRAGKFTVMLSDETNERNSVDGCFAKMQSTSAAAPCPIRTAQTASIKLFGTEKNVAIEEQIKFAPVTCEAMFWLPPNFTCFHNTPPSPEQPVEDTQPPVPPPAQPPFPAFPPPAPEIETPSPQPDDNPLPAPEPAFQIPQTPPHYPPTVSPIAEPIPISDPSPQSPTPIPNPSHQSPTPIPNSSPPSPSPITPQFASPPLPNLAPHYHIKKPHPSLSFPPINPPFPNPNPSPSPQSPTPNPPPNFNHPLPKFPPKPDPFQKLPLPIPPLMVTPKRIKPIPIPRAPPVPRLPHSPTAPRKYFNSPQPKAQPPNPT